jgi:alpha-methylacyl-CoA racemase
MSHHPAKGPLSGVRVLEFAGIGPGPFAAMLLSDFGAEVVRIAREGERAQDDALTRGRHDLTLDLKTSEGVEACLAAIEDADVLIEGFRPGVMERLGLGPEVALARNPRLVYGRMTGWGQDGPLAHAAGHDINYIALTGALAAIGPPGQVSPPPLNLVGDFGGGSLYLVFGVVSALYERERSGKGQVIDAAIVDGAASLMAIFAGGRLSLAKSESLLGGAAPFYRCYECADGRQIAVGALEPKFYDELVRLTGLSSELKRGDRANWPALSEAFADLFRQKTRDQWQALMEGSDTCFAPVLELAEAPDHPHMAARGVYQEAGGFVQPGPAPRLSRTPGEIQAVQADGAAVLQRWRADWRTGT